MFSVNKFLIVGTDRNTIYLRSDDGLDSYTLQVFNINATFVYANLLKIKQNGTDNIITIPFRNNVESQQALKIIQSHIDSIRTKVPFLIDKGVKNYIDDKLLNVDLSAIYATLSIYNDNFNNINATISNINNDINNIYGTLSNFAILNGPNIFLDDQYILGSISASYIQGDGSRITGLSFSDTYVVGISYSNNVLTINQNEGKNPISITFSTDTYINGLSYSNNILFINLNNGQYLTASIDISNGPTGSIGPTGSQIFGLSYSNNILTINQSVGPTLSVNITQKGSFGINIDANSNFITNGNKGYITMPYDGIITDWQIVGNTSGNIQVDIKKSSYSNYPTTISITNGNYIGMTSSYKNNDNILYNWLLNFNKNDIFEFDVISTSNLNKVNIVLSTIKY